jgi:hypothetical protein
MYINNGLLSFVISLQESTSTFWDWGLSGLFFSFIQIEKESFVFFWIRAVLTYFLRKQIIKLYSKEQIKCFYTKIDSNKKHENLLGKRPIKENTWPLSLFQLQIKLAETKTKQFICFSLLKIMSFVVKAPVH